MELSTRIFKGYHGWEGLTTTTAGGKDYQITTIKKSNGYIICSAQEGQIQAGGGFSYMMMGSKNIELAKLKANGTENKIKEVHALGLEEFKKQFENAPEAYKIEVGQIIFTDYIHSGEDERRVIYEILGHGEYKSVRLDGSDIEHESMIRPYTEKFGIGVYYNEGEKMEVSLIPALVAQAKENSRIRTEKIEADLIIERAEAEKKKAFLSQYTRADKRQTTKLIKKHILSLSPTISKVEVTSDSYSGGDSCHVTYYAPFEVEEAESFIKSLQEGHFNGMEDIYEYDKEAAEVIIENHILVKYKYTSARHEEAEAPEIKEVAESANVEPLTVEPGKIQVIEYGQGLAVVGDTKPIKDKLKALGGRFNFRLTCGAGWVFKKSDLQKLQTALSN